MRAAVVFLPMLLLGAILIICLVYFFVYKRYINQRLEGGQSTAHIPMASSDTVFRWLVLIAAAIMLISMHSKLTRIEEELSMTRSESNREILGLRGDIYDLEMELEEQNSLISAFSYEVGEFDVDSMSSEVTFTCTPKSFTEDTAITLTIGDYEIALEKGSGGVFRGTKEMDVFDMLPETAVITITSGGVSQTQMTDQHPWPALCFEALPMGLDVYVAETDFTYESGKYKLDFEVENKAAGQFASLTLVIKVNGAEMERRAITKGSEKFSISVPGEKDDVVAIYAMGVDEYGLTHEVFLEGWSGNGGYWFETDKFPNIFDASGKQLFGE